MIVKLQFYSDIGFNSRNTTGKTERDRNDAPISELANKKQEIERAPIEGTSLQSLPSNLRCFTTAEVHKELDC